MLLTKQQKWHFLSMSTHFFYRYFRYFRWFEFSSCLKSHVIWIFLSKDLINCVGYLLEVFAIRYMMNYFLLLHIFQTTSVNARWEQPWLIQPQSFSKTSLRLAVFACYDLVVKRIVFKTNLLFWIFLVVVYGFIYSHEREKIQDTKYQAFYQRGKCKTFKGVNVVVYWWWMQGNGAWK